MLNFSLYRARRHATKAIQAAEAVHALHEDITTDKKNTSLREMIDAVKTAKKNDDKAKIKTAIEELINAIEFYLPPVKWRGARENFDVIVAALSVAFCFRAYYYQPFKIPTGSMQPTLYGIHVEETTESTAFDKQPLRFFKWLATGETFQDVRIKRPGAIRHNRPSSTKPGYNDIVIGQDVYTIPSDAVANLLDRPSTLYKRGQRLWSGYVKSGDFLFVNRWIWNFRHPKRGEVMIFSTNGIADLPPNTHYIKRMCGIPGDEISIQTPRLFNHGKPVEEPERIAQIAQKMQLPQFVIPYPGFQPAPGGEQHPSKAPREDRLLNTSDKVTLGEGEYYAMGDNSGNSLDSRYWGKVSSTKLLGPASFVHWPLTSARWGIIE